MRKLFLFTLLLLCSVITLSAQQNRTGNVELVEADANGNLLTFSVNGSANKKNDVIISAKETLFYKLLYQGVEGVNDGKMHIIHEKKYWLENFLTGKNAPYNALIDGIEQEGPVSKTTDGYFGTFNIVLKYKAFIKTLQLNGIIDGDNSKSVAAAEAKRFGLEAKKQPKPQPTPQSKSIQASQQNTSIQKEQTQPTSANQSVVVATTEAKAPSGQEKLVMTKNGFGPIKLGDNPTIPNVFNRCKLPDTFDNLYDKLICDHNQFSGYFEICGNLNGEMSFVAFCGENDTIEDFFVVTPTVETAEGLTVKSTAKEILAAGAVYEKLTLNENGKVTVTGLCLKLNGLFFLFSSKDVVQLKTIKDDALPVVISNFKYANSTEYLLFE